MIILPITHILDDPSFANEGGNFHGSFSVWPGNARKHQRFMIYACPGRVRLLAIHHDKLALADTQSPFRGEQVPWHGKGPGLLHATLNWLEHQSQ